MSSFACAIYEVLISAAETITCYACAAELLTKPTTEKLPSDAEGLQASFAKLESVIAQTAAYVDDVVVRRADNSGCMAIPSCLCAITTWLPSLHASRPGENSRHAVCRSDPCHFLCPGSGLFKARWCGLDVTGCCMAQAGRREGDRAIGRFLADTVDAVPLVSREDLEVLFNQNVQVSPCFRSGIGALFPSSTPWQLYLHPR